MSFILFIQLQTFKTGKPPSERGEDGALKGNFGFIWKISEKVTAATFLK